MKYFMCICEITSNTMSYTCAIFCVCGWLRDLFLLPFTDETNLPSDIPSYLSSQGTLAERQDGYVPSESGSNYQYVSSSMGGFYLQPKDMKGIAPY